MLATVASRGTKVQKTKKEKLYLQNKCAYKTNKMTFVLLVYVMYLL